MSLVVHNDNGSVYYGTMLTLPVIVFRKFLAHLQCCLCVHLVVLHRRLLWVLLRSDALEKLIHQDCHWQLFIVGSQFSVVSAHIANVTLPMCAHKWWAIPMEEHTSWPPRELAEIGLQRRMQEVRGFMAWARECILKRSQVPMQLSCLLVQMCLQQGLLLCLHQKINDGRMACSQPWHLRVTLPH